MSYPNFGCFAECLRCELCDESMDDEGIDLFGFGDIYGGDADGDGTPDWADPDWGPEPLDESGPFDDFPTGVPLGDEGELRPTWDPYGVDFRWDF